MNEKVVAYTDGACKGNPGPGGWGVLLLYKSNEKELYGGEANTTNNRMELTAAIEGLRQLTRPCQVVLTTDSQYLVKGITEWIKGWQRSGWKNSKKEPVVNRDLWELLLKLSENRSIRWNWVRGHNGHVENERCDQLAREAIAGLG